MGAAIPTCDRYRVGVSDEAPAAPPGPAVRAWLEAAAKVLAKAGTPAGDDPAAALTSTRAGGLVVRPLYTAADERAEDPPPGVFPFTRGSGAGWPDGRTGWHVAERFETGGDPAELNTAVLQALGNGASAIWLGGSPGADELTRALRGVHPGIAPLLLDGAVDALAATAGHVVSLGAAPLTAALTGAETVSAERAIEAARGLWGTIFTADGYAAHNAGAGEALELGIALAAGAGYLRALLASGRTLPEAFAAIDFRLAASDDQFATIAKLRAARLLWARVAEASGAAEAGRARIHAVTSLAMASQRDPYVNVLRGTIAGLAAGVGGAELVTVHPFDVAIPGGQPGAARGLARRIARNTQALLLEESQLGRVLDPGAGCWWLEQATRQLAADGWAAFRRIEAAGGLPDAAAQVRAELAEAAAARDDLVARRAVRLTGVNDYPNLAEPSPATDPGPIADRTDLPTGSPALARWGRVFERLRDRSDALLAATGVRPRALLLPIGPLARHNSAATETANLLASGGIEAINPGPVEPGGIAAVVTEHAPALAVITGRPDDLADGADAHRDAAKAAGVPRVEVADWGADIDAAALLDDLLGDFETAEEARR